MFYLRVTPYFSSGQKSFPSLSLGEEEKYSKIIGPCSSEQGPFSFIFISLKEDVENGESLIFQAFNFSFKYFFFQFFSHFLKRKRRDVGEREKKRRNDNNHTAVTVFFIKRWGRCVVIVT